MRKVGSAVVHHTVGMGRTNERIGRIQETYVANATSSWMESLERSLAQMKEYLVHAASYPELNGG